MEYFVVANSFPAPFVSDQSTGYFTSDDDPKRAMEEYAAGYSHPCGMFAAGLYASADAYHKGEKPLVRWMSNKALVQQAEAHPEGGVAL